jgi:hypothetical protein
MAIFRVHEPPHQRPEPRTLKTDAGDLDLVPATLDQLDGLYRYWPMGIVDIFAERDGLVFQRGDQELYGVKFQHVDRPEPLAHFVHLSDCALVASALPYYVEHQHRGVMVPCPYIKKKSSGLVETGITYFVGPDVASRALYYEKNDTLFDQLGVGATAMIFHMQLAVVRASKERGLPIDYFLTHELRRRLAVRSIVMHFAIHGPHIVVIKSPIKEADLTWGHVVRAGYTRLPYAPMVPAAGPDSQAEDVRRT